MIKLPHRGLLGPCRLAAGYKGGSVRRRSCSKRHLGGNVISWNLGTHEHHGWRLTLYGGLRVVKADAQGVKQGWPD